MSADSTRLPGARPLADMAAACGLVSQSSLLAMTAPLASCNSSTGSSRTFCTPAAPSEGPKARTIRFLDSLPLMMHPPMRTFSARPTRIRVEMFAKWDVRVAGPGVAVGVAVGDGVGVAVGDGAGVGADNGAP